MATLAEKRASYAELVAEPKTEAPMTTNTAPVTEPIQSFADALRTPDSMREACYMTWRVVSHNPNYTGQTEGFGFSNGEAVISALPRSAPADRVEERILRLSTLASYPAYEERRSRQNVLSLKAVQGYRVLTEAEYDAEFADRTVSEGPPEDL